jgi:hypothetical protein
MVVQLMDYFCSKYFCDQRPIPSLFCSYHDTTPKARNPTSAEQAASLFYFTEPRMVRQQKNCELLCCTRLLAHVSFLNFPIMSSSAIVHPFALKALNYFACKKCSDKWARIQKELRVIRATD